MRNPSHIDEFRSLLVSATRGVVDDLFHRFPDETFYAFALYTFDDLAGVNPSASAESGFEKRKQTLLADTKGLAWHKEHGISVDSSLFGDYRWSAYEWEHECHLVHSYAPASDLMCRLRDEKIDADNGFGELAGSALAAMVMALRVLDLEGVFKNRHGQDSITLFCSKPHSDDTCWLERESARLLNSESAWQTFKKQRIDYIAEEADDFQSVTRMTFDAVIKASGLFPK